ncbi:hypothetical protein [Salmonella enterica]|uniref:hypothetical protein n=1 Tax=Salmonella enterica TaxID=28901 RepID=UPI0003A3F9C0|nr:hypothetical protein [Salmonella enterica]
MIDVSAPESADAAVLARHLAGLHGGAALTGPTDSVGRISERAIRHDVVPDEGKKCRVAWNY